jgi:hypothetical protein
VQPRRVALLVTVAAGLLGATFLGAAPVDDDGPPPADHLVALEDTEGYVWPYTSRSRSVEGRTLAITVVVRADSARVRQALESRSDVDWAPVAADADVTVGDSPWRPARGAARFTYVAGETPATGRWVESTYQLGTGTYLGRRVHVRAYPVPSGQWTALQTHAEYWDWFRLRHTVTGVASGARFVERDLRGEPFVAGVDRIHHGLEGGGSDGWLTVVEFAPAVVLAASTVRFLDRSDDAAADVALLAALAGLVVAVRLLGVAAERAVPGVTPKVFAAALYPVLVAGPLLAVAGLGRGRHPSRTALVAAAGLGLGVVADLGVVGVSTVPVRLALHRVALTAALGLFALGVARTDRRTTWLGAAAWLVTLSAPLVGVV